MEILVDINDSIIDELANKLAYKPMVVDENDQPIENPMSKQDFIKQVVVKQVVDLLLEDRIKAEVDNLITGMRPVVENAIKQQVIIR